MFVIRPAEPADARALAEVHVAAWRESYRGLMPDAAIEAKSVADREAQWLRTLTTDRPGADVLVAEAAEGAIVGFVSAGPQRDPGLGTIGEIYAIYVLRAHQGRGIGRALFQAATRALLSRGIDSVGLWVLEGNDPASRFYERQGGRPGGTDEEEVGGVRLLHRAWIWPDLRTVGTTGDQVLVDS